MDNEIKISFLKESLNNHGMVLAISAADSVSVHKTRMNLIKEICKLKRNNS